MEIEILNSSQSFNLGKNIYRIRVGTTQYSVPKTVTISNKAIITANADGTVKVSAFPNFLGVVTLGVTYTDRTTDTINISVVEKKTETVETPPSDTGGTTDTGTGGTTGQDSGGTTTTPTEPAPSTTDPDKAPTVLPGYVWHRKIANTSKGEDGPGFLRGLRSPTSVVEHNNFVYIGLGFPEGNSSIMKIPVDNLYVMSDVRTEVTPPEHKDIVGEVNSMIKIGDIIYCAIKDPYSSGGGIFAIQNDQEYLFNEAGTVNKYTTTFKGQWQETPYKSVIIQAGIERLEVISNSIAAITGTKYVLYDPISGKNLGTFNYPSTTMCKSTYGNLSVTINMTEARGSNGVVYATAQKPNQPFLDNKTYTPYDYNFQTPKASVHVSETKVYITDAGNSRVLIYAHDGTYLDQIVYVPMSYNSSVDRNNPTRAFSGYVEYEVEYPSLKFKVKANWASSIRDKGFVKVGDNMNREVLRDVITVNGKTFGLIDWHDTDGSRKPTLMELTTSGAVEVKKFDWFENVHIGFDGNHYSMSKNNTTASFYKNGVLMYNVSIPSGSPLAGSVGKIAYMENGSFVVYNPDKSHTGNHIAWIKDGKVVATAMPTKNISNTEARANPFMYGDFFPVDPDVEYAGGTAVKVCGNYVAVRYVGEFFGGAGGQTELWYIYDSTGKFVMRVGKTSWEAEAQGGKDLPRELGGDAVGSGGQFVKIGNEYWIIHNTEHTGALQSFRIYGL